MDVSPSRRRPKRPADAQHSSSSSPATSPSSQWIRSIQNQSFQPKPTAYSPHSLQDEDPLMLQQRQCRDKLRALRQVRERIKFYPLKSNIDSGDVAASSSSMNISTRMILSGQDWQEEEEENEQEQNDGQLKKKSTRQHVGIDALGGLEMLLFAFFSRRELLRVSVVCRAWRALARDDLFWEPLLVTQLEKYPLRPLLGLERDQKHRCGDVPAILVYMVYQRLKLAQAAYTQECGDRNGYTAAATRYTNGRFLELFQTLNRQGQVGALPRLRRTSRVRGDEPVSSVHLVCVKGNVRASAMRMQEDQEVAQMAAGLHLQPFDGNRGVNAAEVPNLVVPVPEPDEQQPAVVNAQNGVGAADDEDVYSVADGQDRVTLSAWLSTKHRVSERTLRSFLRQMLLAVDALERSNCEHADISPVNIVVRSQPRIRKQEAVPNTMTPTREGESDEEEDEADDDDADMLMAHGLEAKVLHDCRRHTKRYTPFFQLFISRRNCQHNGERVLDPVFPVDANVNVPAGMADLNGDGLREIAQQRQRLADAEAEAAVVRGNEGIVGAGGGLAALRNRLGLPHPSMVSSVIQTAMTMWARGRFVDSSVSTVLVLLLRFPNSFPSSLRSFLEYAKYLIITHSATASKLLRHEYLQSPGATLAHKQSPHWSTTPINDVNEYKIKLLAYYGSLPSRAEGLLVDSSSSSSNPTVIDELMPRTNLGVQYFSRALEETNLPGERFMSVVAPSTASSSWARKLASTQTCTLQRLDISHARVPTSVLLQELVTLPRLTHLRLPRQILRDENLEHLVAALAYGHLLPRLRGLDENVRQAMDRMEKSYLMQLDMVTFLLQKTSESAAPRNSS